MNDESGQLENFMFVSKATNTTLGEYSVISPAQSLEFPDHWFAIPDACRAAGNASGDL